MASRRRNRRVQVQSSDVAVGAGVHAPSNVAATSRAAQQAASLAGALGFAQQFAVDETQRRQDEDFQLGSEAAARGDFTEEELHGLEKSAAFVLGAEKVLAKERSILDAAAAREYYQTEVDKTLSPAEVDAVMDQWWSQRYAGLSTGMAREVLPYMQKARDEILTSHADLLSVETQNELTTAQATIMDEALRTGSYDHEAFRAASNKLIGKDATNALITERAIAFAAAQGDETILDRPEFKMLRQNRQFQPDFQKAHSEIRNARIEAAEQATFAEQGALQAQIGQLADNADPRFWQMLERGTAANDSGVRVVETDAEVEAYITRFFRAQESAQVGSVNTTLWATGNGRSMKNNAERDAAAVAHAEKVVQAAIAEGAAEDEAAALGRAALIDASVRNHYVPQPLKDQIEVSPENAEAWTAGFDLYTQLRARDPSGLTRKQLDSDAIRAYETYERMLRQTGDAERAREAIAASDFGLWKNLTDSAKREMEDSVVGTLRDGLLFGDNDIADTNRLRTMVEEDLEYYVAKGFDEKTAVQMAVNNLKPGNGRYTVVDGHLYRSHEGWGAQADSVVEQAKRAYAEQNEVKTWYGSLDTDDVAVTPVPNREGYVYITGPGPLQNLGSTQEVPISLLNDGYEAHLMQIAQQSSTSVDELLMERAKSELYPLPSEIGGVGTDVRRNLAKQKQDEMWDALTPTQRDALIDRQRR